MKLHDVHQGVQKNKRAKRVGRGIGSGHGKTAGRGHKGQGALAGWSHLSIFQGGTMPLVRRVPKRGFNNKWARKIVIVNVGALEQAFESGAEVNPEVLSKSPLVGHRFDEIKILGEGELTKKLTVAAHRFSQSAIEKIEKAGGKIVRLSGPTPVSEKQAAASSAEGSS